MDDSMKNVHALGKLSQREIASLLLQSHAFCLPTRSEGFSTSLLEAAACGCVPVITNVGGVEELIPDDSFGIVIQDTRSDTIAHAIQYLYEHRGTCTSMAQNIRERTLTLFTWQATAKQVMAAFQNTGTTNASA